MSGEMFGQVVAELARFLGVTYQEAMERVQRYNKDKPNEIWNKKPPRTVEDVEQFYKENDHYLYELIPWNYASAEFHRRVEPLFHYHNKNILEIGGGIGSLSIALAYAGNSVTYVDINPILQSFAVQRFTDRQLPIPVYGDLSRCRDMDMVVAIDVLEHIHPDRLPAFLKEIASCLSDGGFLYHRSNFKQQNLYPMHYDHSEYFGKMCKDAGLSERENGDWVKGSTTFGVQIGIPILGDIPDPLFFSFLGLKKKHGWKLTKIRDKDVASARNEIVDKLEKDWLFFMDADMTFPPDAIERLLSWNVDIVSGLYFKSPGIPMPHAYEYAYAKDMPQDGQPDHYYAPLCQKVGEYLHKYKSEIENAEEEALILPKEELIPIDGCGGGCLLINRRVFDKIEKPYFQFTKDARAGEDFYFCRKARQAGFEIWLDPGVICGHKQKGMIGAGHFMHWSTCKEGVIPYMYPWGHEAKHTTAKKQTSVEVDK